MEARIEPGTEDGARAIHDLLVAHNAEAGWPSDRVPLDLLLRGPDGAVAGGLVGRTAWRWLYVENLVVAPALRGQGWGARLVAAAEAEARARGCVGIRLDTYDFQARPFYERLGFHVAGQIEDCPPGHTRFTLAKHLRPLPGRAVEGGVAGLAVTLTDGEGDPLVAVLDEGLTEHNRPFAGHHGYRPLNLSVRREGEAAPLGGLTGYTLYGWLFVRLFHLPPALRGTGLGTRLLTAAEAEARARGCVGVWLDTFAFQAPAFYRRLGYVAFGTLPDMPPGHARHFLMKRLDGETDVPT